MTDITCLDLLLWATDDIDARLEVYADVMAGKGKCPIVDSCKKAQTAIRDGRKFLWQQPKSIQLSLFDEDVENNGE